METVTVKYNGPCPSFITVWEGTKISIPNGRTEKVPVSWWDHYKDHPRSSELELVKSKKVKKDNGNTNE